MPGGRTPLTKEIVNQKLSTRFIRLVDDYKTSQTISIFECSKNHRWAKRVSAVLSGLGCPHCANRFPITKEVLNFRLKSRQIEIIGDCVGMQRKSLFRCSIGHEWIATPDSIANSGNGCPNCSTSGFKLNLPAYCYVIRFSDFIKFGVSNNLKSRFKQHRKNGEFEVIITKFLDSGEVALNWEKMIKTKFDCNYATKEQCPDGFTETLPLNLLEEIKHSLENFKR